MARARRSWCSLVATRRSRRHPPHRAKRPARVSGAGELSALAPVYNEASRAATRQSSGRRYQEHKVLWQSRVAEYAPYRGLADTLFPPDAVMTVGPIGVIGYMLPDLTIIDFFGLTDRAVARNPVTRPNSKRQLAHDRRPPPGYLKSRGVNLEVLGASQRFGPASEHALRPGRWRLDAALVSRPGVAAARVRWAPVVVERAAPRAARESGLDGRWPLSARPRAGLLRPRAWRLGCAGRRPGRGHRSRARKGAAARSGLRSSTANTPGPVTRRRAS